MSDGVRVVFAPSGRRGSFPAGTSVLEAARALGVDLDSVCGGRGICGRCQVAVSEGTHAKLGIRSSTRHLTPFSEPEGRYRARSGLAPERRLGCHARLLGDVVVDVPPDSQLHRQVVRKQAEARDIELDPVVRLHHVEVEPPTLGSQASDLARLLQALEREWGLAGLEADLHVVRGLQAALRAGEWAVTVAVHDGSTVTAVWPGFRDLALGSVGRGELEADRHAVRGADEVEPEAPEAARVGGAVAVGRVARELRALDGLARLGAGDRGRVEQPQPIAAGGREVGEAAAEPDDLGRQRPDALVVAGLLRDVGEEVAEAATGEAQEAPLVGAVEEDLGDGERDQLGVGDPRRAARSAALRQEIVGEHIKCGEKGVEVGEHVASLVDVAVSNAPFDATGLLVG